MKKKVLHLQVPIIEGSTRQDNLAISASLLGKFMKFVNLALGDEWDAIASPMTPSKDSNVTNFNLSELSRNEFLDMIGERSIRARVRRGYYDLLAWWNYKKWEIKYKLKDDVVLPYNIWFIRRRLKNRLLADKIRNILISAWQDPFRRK